MSKRSDTLADLRNLITQIEEGDPGAKNSDSSKVELGLDTAFRKITRLCAQREQSSKELRKRLAREGYSAEVVDKAIERSCACGLLDDRRFAEVLVRSRLAAGKGLLGIARELNSHDLDASEIEAYTEAEALGEDAELARACEVLRRKPPRAKNAREAAYRRLVQKGYSSSVAAKAARLWFEE